MLVRGAILISLVLGTAGSRHKIFSAGTQNLAVLQHLRSTAHTKAGSRLIDKLSALLERGQEDATPDFTAAFAGAVDHALEEIRNTVKPLISEAHTSTQTEINSRVAAVQASSGEAQAEKSKAVEKDTAWNECIRQEKNDRIAVETAESEKAQAIEEERQAIAAEDAAKDFSDSITLEPFECDFREQEGGSCWSSYEASVQTKLANLRTKMDDKEAIYQAAATRLSNARASLEAAKTKLANAINTWSGQRAACIDVDADRTQALCSLGEKLKLKCQSVDSYRDLVQHIGETGTQWSHPDREHEHATVQVTECLLDKARAGSPLTAGDVTSCEDKVVSIGDLDLKQSELTSFVTGEYFTCAETEIILTGKHWNIPDPAAAEPPSASYEEIMDYAEAINPYEGFTFCEGEPGK